MNGDCNSHGYSFNADLRRNQRIDSVWRKRSAHRGNTKALIDDGKDLGTWISPSDIKDFQGRLSQGANWPHGTHPFTESIRPFQP